MTRSRTAGLQNEGSYFEELRQSFSADEMRLSVVYRARCFASEEEKQRYADEANSPHMQLRLEEDILTPLQDELVRRGRVMREYLASMSRLDLALLLVDEFISYPVAHPDLMTFPFNYCALSQRWPMLSSIIDTICS